MPIVAATGPAANDLLDACTEIGMEAVKRDTAASDLSADLLPGLLRAALVDVLAELRVIA